MAPGKRPKNLYQFHYRSQLPNTETRSEKKARLACQKRTKAEIGDSIRRQINRRDTQDQNDQESTNPDNPDTETHAQESLGFNENSLWEDTGEYMNDEDSNSLARIRSLHEEFIQKQKHQHWKDVMDSMFPVYLHLKNQTADWTLPCALDNFSSLLCKCTPDRYKIREVDLIDLMVLLLANGYLSCTPIAPQTAFSIRLLNFYDLLWNVCNTHATPFCKVLQTWNEAISVRLFAKNSKRPRDLRRNLVGSIDAYRTLKSMQRNLVQTVTSITKQEVLAQQSCPACFGVALPNDPTFNPDSHSTQPSDTNKIFICLDGNFQHRHHERASKNYLGLENEPLFVTPEEIALSNVEIREGEIAKRVSQKAHKAADDRRNASSWKGCDDTGLFGCCCRHDSVISFCNIHKTGEGRGLPMSIIKKLFSEINPDIKLGILYDIGCTLKKFFQARGLLSNYLPRMLFATAVFHSYVHDWPCQLQFNPRYNDGWGLTDGEGLERLWSYLSPLVSPLRYATRNHRITAINHRSLFHNTLGIEKLVLTLKRKFIHAIATKIESQKIVQRMLKDQNPHEPGQCFTEDFFRAEWKKQRDFEINRNETDRLKKEEQAQFFERGEALKSLVLASSSAHSDPTHALSMLEEIRDLQQKQDEEIERLGSHFAVDTGAERNREQEKRLALLWSAKSALYKYAVQIQGEMQPLRDSKSHGERLGTVLKEKIFEALGRRKNTVTRVLKTFCDRRTDYLKNHAPNQLSLPENKAITYDDFTKLKLDDPFWNDAYLCLSKDPWAVDPTVRTGIHALLRLDRAKEELIQLNNELRRCLSWGIQHRKQIKLRIDQCFSDTVDQHLKAVLEDSFGQVSYQTRKILSDELESVQRKHEHLLLSWQPAVQEILALGTVSRSALPAEWFALVEFLKQSDAVNGLETADVDLLLEETILNRQDSDGESANDDINEGAIGVEHVPPEDDDGELS
ncbi:hypothetical protein PGT21_006011 [Puccinia graminis f. sp. tritici]|uniref:CxC1-like cysteine cluster associated with KDZ transposases domain-containing protein n=1 Tax=Puccinia graminis f. sp. tritici TaxID=56615 RepID=A0A5B0PMA2_PUCGR|nr:hypothetical protein PGT21_006011 [Puccinia graminis f. sp. tritici]